MSYPYLSDVVKAATGIDLPLPLATFGLMVALATLAAATCLQAEIRRLHGSGRDGRWGSFAQPPHEYIPNFTLAVLLAGVLGARLFHILDHLDQFEQAPWAMIFSRSGLSIFGGLIGGTLAGLFVVRRWRLPAVPMLDATAPAMMLGYAIGRIGCQISGDGDWGRVANMALKPDWLPTWAWAQTYDNNIYGELIAAPGVYPAPMYETAMGLLCFALLWTLRRHPFKAGWLFSVYLVLTGVERFLIEQIRINPVVHLGPFAGTQAEMIAVALLGCGLLGIAVLSRRTLTNRPLFSKR
ncbi:MAG: prolipoprotein diacylglyceryl transferase family protein [Pseudomonadota bacterium]